MSNPNDGRNGPFVTWEYCAPFADGMMYAAEGQFRQSFVLRKDGKELARFTQKIPYTKWELAFEESRIELGQRNRALGYELKDKASGQSIGWTTFPNQTCDYRHSSGSIYGALYDTGIWKMQDANGRLLAQMLPRQRAMFVEGNFDEIDRKEEDPHLFIIWAILILLATGSRLIY